MLNLTNRNKLKQIVVCTLIDNDIRHHIGDQNHDTKKEQALSITFLQYEWFISQIGRSCFDASMTQTSLSRLLSTTAN